MTQPTPDLEALLCALVLAPTTFARNRFFALYTEPPAKRVRSRAMQLRTIVRHLAGRDRLTGEVTMHRVDERGTELRYAVADLRLARTAFLEPLEAALVRCALDRAGGSPLPLLDSDRATVEHALAKLGDRLPVPATALSTLPNPDG